MADITYTVAGGAVKKLKDMGDGTHAEVVKLAANPSIDIGEINLQNAAGAVINPATQETLASVLAALGGCGCYATATFTPAAAAYSAGDIQDTAKALTWYYANGVAVPATAIIRVTTTILKIAVTAVPSGQTSYTLALLKAARSTPLADNDAWTIPTAESDNYMDKLALGTPATVSSSNSFLSIRQAGLSNDYQIVAGGLVAELITDGAHTAAAVARTVKLAGVVL